MGQANTDVLKWAWTNLDVYNTSWGRLTHTPWGIDGHGRTLIDTDGPFLGLKQSAV